MFVRTERLFLRPGWPEDSDDLVEALSGDGIQRTLGAAPLPHGAGQVRAYLKRARDPRLPQFFMYLRSPGGPRLVGGIGLALYDTQVEVEYWITPSQTGRGFAGEALRAVVSQARSLGHRRIMASHFSDCPGTHEVLESAGFRDTGKVCSRYSTGRAMEYAARIYIADLEKRPGAQPCAMPSMAAGARLEAMGFRPAQ